MISPTGLSEEKASYFAEQVLIYLLLVSELAK